MNIHTYLAISATMSPNMAYLEAIFPGKAALPILLVAEIIGMPMKTMRNLSSNDTFPIPSFKQGARRMCLKAEVAAYLDRIAGVQPKPKRGARTKAERIRADAANDRRPPCPSN